MFTLAVRRAAPRVASNQQKRGIVDYLVKYPDRVMEMKKIQCAGGTCQGEANPTWLKQPGDTAVALFGAGLIAYGGVLCTVGYYRLATGKGKKE